MGFAPQRRAPFRQLDDIWTSKSGPNVWLFFIFLTQNALRATTPCTFSASQLPKVVRTWYVLYIFTSKFASRHNGVHFFDISTPKSGRTLVCFVRFHFHTCFARKASVRLGSFRFVETANRVGSVHEMAGSFRFARHCGSVRFGSWKPQAGPVRFM